MAGQFDLMSDAHIDFWVKVTLNPQKMIIKLNERVDSWVPANPSRVLVIAGDIGHYNHQNALLLGSLKRYYKSIIIVRGNHDLYLVTGKQRSKYKASSVKRWNEMKAMILAMDDVAVLEGQTVTRDGITFGGTGMWYDFSYGIRELGKTNEEMRALWRKRMNDAIRIDEVPDWEEEAARFDGVIEQSEVLVSHVGGDWSQLSDRSSKAPGYVHGPEAGFYFFDGSKWLDRLNGKVWCFGHIHDHCDYVKAGCRFINHAIGYPGDRESAGIRTIKL